LPPLPVPFVTKVMTSKTLLPTGLHCTKEITHHSVFANHKVLCISVTLTIVEKNYGQLAKEALAST